MAKATVEASNLEASRRADVLRAKYRAIAQMIDMSTASRKCFRAAIAEYFGSARKAQPKSFAIRLLEWIFTRELRFARAKGCCDYCDSVTPANAVNWAAKILGIKQKR